MLKKISKIFKSIPILNKKEMQTFTYYLPAPPNKGRNRGYRETEFDKLTQFIVEQGYSIIDIKTSSHSGPDNAGTWIICTIVPNQGKSKPLDLHFDAPTEEPEIEGIYNLTPIEQDEVTDDNREFSNGKEIEL